jgi:hypothetical protein
MATGGRWLRAGNDTNGENTDKFFLTQIGRNTDIIGYLRDIRPFVSFVREKPR